MSNPSLPETALLRGIWHALLDDIRSLGLCSSVSLDALQNASEESELVSFLTVTLPSMGRVFDALLLSEGTKRPVFDLPPLLVGLLSLNGPPSVPPSTALTRALRQLFYLFYKYESEPSKESVEAVLSKFIKTEEEVLDPVPDCGLSGDRKALERALKSLDLHDIYPKHGPGAVAGRERGMEKYVWSHLPNRTLSVYSYEYFCASFDHLASSLGDLRSVLDEEPYARIVTVPKDSRGPRVISVEPKEFQWLQQGQMRKLVPYVENHKAFQRQVLFRDQRVNGQYALRGSIDQSYATLDLSEASDRVSLDYVKKVFPDHVLTYILASRSLGTCMPNGMQVRFRKFAPMGSAMCFPVLALTCWARLNSAGLRNVHIFGDDIVVPGVQAHAAIDALEAIGLKTNPIKCCTTGFFRESCGVDAYKGVVVTPLRIKQRWSESRSAAEALSAWCAYAFHAFERGLTGVATYVAKQLTRVYGSLPSDQGGQVLNVPCLPPVLPCAPRKQLTRRNPNLQVLETKALVLRSRPSKLKPNSRDAILHWMSTRGEGRVDRPGQVPIKAHLSYASPTRPRIVRCWTEVRTLGPSKDILAPAHVPDTNVWCMPDSSGSHL